MTEQHPITAPSELMYKLCDNPKLTWMERLHLAYQAGAEQELEACCKVLTDENPCGFWTDLLRSARRPTPTLKEQAIAVLEDANLDSAHHNILLRALEALPE
jgi:hypothetical protein